MSFSAKEQPAADLSFRRPHASDGEALKGLLEALWEDGDRGADLERRLGGRDSYFEHLRKTPDACRVAEWKGAVAGFAAWRQDEGFAVIDSHKIAERARGWNIEVPLLRDVLRILRSEGVRSVESRLPSGREDIGRMYGSLGFRELGKTCGKSIALTTYEIRLH